MSHVNRCMPAVARSTCWERANRAERAIGWWILPAEFVIGSRIGARRTPHLVVTRVRANHFACVLRISSFTSAAAVGR
jgi:hypothetical protein